MGRAWWKQLIKKARSVVPKRSGASSDRAIDQTSGWWFELLIGFRAKVMVGAVDGSELKNAYSPSI